MTKLTPAIGTPRGASAQGDLNSLGRSEETLASSIASHAARDHERGWAAGPGLHTTQRANVERSLLLADSRADRRDAPVPRLIPGSRRHV
jgi:hypothetical protein